MVREAMETGVKAIRSLKVNGLVVQSTATPMRGSRDGRVYRLFYVSDPSNSRPLRRVAKTSLTDKLLSTV